MVISATGFRVSSNCLIQGNIILKRLAMSFFASLVFAFCNLFALPESGLGLFINCAKFIN